MIKIELKMRKGRDKQHMIAVAKPAQLITRFSSVAEAWKTYLGLKEKGEIVVCKRNVVFQDFPDKTEMEIADHAEKQAKLMLAKIMKDEGKIKYTLKREVLK